MIVEIPAHMSWSQASNLVGSWCPAAYFYERVLGKPARPAWAAIGGSALHSATEDWDREAITGIVEVDPGVLGSMFARRFDEQIATTAEYTNFDQSEWRASGRASKAWPDKEGEAFWRATGPSWVAAYAAWRLTSSWEIAFLEDKNGNVVPGIEIPLDITLGGQPVRGYIDRVFSQNVDGETVYAICDLKTSQREPDDAGQLQTYDWGLQDQWGITPRWGFYWMARTGASTAFKDVRAHSRAEMDFTYREAAALRARGGFVHKPSNMCGSCALKDYCPKVGGAKAAETPQPWDITGVVVAAPK